MDLHLKGVKTDWKYEWVFSENNHCHNDTHLGYYTTLLVIPHI